MYVSYGFTPAPCTRTRTCPSAGLGVGTSSNFRASGPPNSWTTIAFIFGLRQQGQFSESLVGLRFRARLGVLAELGGSPSKLRINVLRPCDASLEASIRSPRNVHPHAHEQALFPFRVDPRIGPRLWSASCLCLFSGGSMAVAFDSNEWPAPECTVHTCGGVR